jgi:hypothetical protein
MPAIVTTWQLQETRFSTSIALTIGYTACKRVATSTVITTIFALLFVNDAY